MGSLLRQAQQLQREIERVKKELEAARVQGSAGGGVVKVEVSGDRRVTSIAIDPELLRGGDAKLLEDLVLAAIREGMDKAAKLAETSMQRVTGGLSLPGMF
jgi:DNA-binding YbaB/EbfC family protein